MSQIDQDHSPTLSPPFSAPATVQSRNLADVPRAPDIDDPFAHTIDAAITAADVEANLNFELSSCLHTSKYDALTTRRFRNLVLDTLPSLRHPPVLPDNAALSTKEEIRMRIFYYLLSTTFVDEETSIPVMPFELIRQFAGIRRTTWFFAAIEYLQDFSQHVLPLEINDYRYANGKARTIVMRLPEDLRDEYERSLFHLGNPNQERVNFFTGHVVSRRLSRQGRQDHRERLIASSLSTVKDDKHGQILEYLNRQSPGKIEEYIKGHLPELYEAASSMDRTTEHEINQRNHTFRVIAGLQRHTDMIYQCSPKSDRVCTIGSTIHQLPRELRKLAIQGPSSFGCDLKSAQLAIVARLWNLDQNRSFLESGGSIWTELLGHLCLDTSYKDTLKQAMYSIVFGKTEQNLKIFLEEGGMGIRPLSHERITQFFRYPLIREILEGRQRHFNKIKSDGGTYDAFGGWIKRIQHECPPHAVAALQAQSFEFAIMLPVLDELRQHPDRYTVLSFLHDGLTIHCRDEARKNTIFETLRKRVQEKAQQLGIPTILERD